MCRFLAEGPQAVREAAVRGARGLPRALDELALAEASGTRPPRPGWWPVAVLAQYAIAMGVNVSVPKNTAVVELQAWLHRRTQLVASRPLSASCAKRPGRPPPWAPFVPMEARFAQPPRPAPAPANEVASGSV